MKKKTKKKAKRPGVLLFTREQLHSMHGAGKCDERCDIVAWLKDIASQPTHHELEHRDDVFRRVAEAIIKGTHVGASKGMSSADVLKGGVAP